MYYICRQYVYTHHSAAFHKAYQVDEKYFFCLKTEGQVESLLSNAASRPANKERHFRKPQSSLKDIRNATRLKRSAYNGKMTSNCEQHELDFNEMASKPPH